MTAARDVTGIVWHLGVEGGGVMLPYVMLRPDGTIGGYTHPNERGWRRDGEAIALLDEQGEPSCILEPSGDGFRGLYVRNRAVVHALRPATIIYPLSFRWSPACTRAMQDLPVFFRNFRVPHPRFADGDVVTIPRRVLAEPDSTMPDGGWLTMGAHSYVNESFRGHAVVGRYCSIARGCMVMGDQHPTDRVTTSHVSYDGMFEQEARRLYGREHRVLHHDHQRHAAITLGHDVWVGEEVLFKGGVTIGDGAVIAARAVVTRDVEPYTIMGGVPARPIRRRFPDDLIERLRTLAWWRFNYPDLPRTWDDPAAFCDELDARIAAGTIAPWEPGWHDLGALLLRASLSD